MLMSALSLCSQQKLWQNGLIFVSTVELVWTIVRKQLTPYLKNNET